MQSWQLDNFQGQETIILSLCSCYGEYGSRGLSFILGRSRINVAISCAQRFAFVVPIRALQPCGLVRSEK